MRPKPTGWYALPFVAMIALIFCLYWSTFSWWWTEWTYPGSFYAHAVFVPFFVAVMIWRNRERLDTAQWKPSWAGVPLLVLAMAALMFAQRSDVTVIKSLSFILMLLGSALLLLGKVWTRVLLFPLLFVIMMMPLIPDQLINSIAFPIQMTSATFASKMLNLITLHNTQQGTAIQMESYKMAVELPCSGFKTLVSLMTFSAAFAYLVEGALWKRWALFLCTIPLSLFINALRITFIGVVGELISAKAAAAFHDYSGFIVLIMAFLFLFNFARILRCERFLGVPLDDEPPAPAKPKNAAAGADAVVSEKRETAGSFASVSAKTGEAATETASESARAAITPPWWLVLLSLRPTAAHMRRVLPFVLAINLILLVSLAVEGYATRPPVPQNPIATKQVPTTLTGGGMVWNADVNDKYLDKLPQDVQEVLKPTRIINRTYKSAQGGQMQFFMTSGNGRKVFHDPHTCMLGGNAILKDIQQVDIPTKHGTVRVQESHYKYADMPDEFLMMFCYVVEDKVVQSTTQIRNAMILQTFLGDSGKPSYFFRVTQQMPGTGEMQRQQMIGFIAGLWDAIGPILTGKEKGIEEAAPVPVSEHLIPER